MSEKNNGIINGGTPEDNQGGTGNTRKNILVRVWERARRGYVEIKRTRTGRVVIGCTKAAAIGLGLYEAGRAGYRRGVKDATPQCIPEVTPEEPTAQEEEPVAQEQEDPAVEEETEI